MILKGNIVQREKIELEKSEKAHVHQPLSRTVYGEIDNKKYSVVIREPTPPAGTGAEAIPDADITTIAWDEKLYIEWEESAGVASYYDITLKDSNGDIVATVEGLDPSNVSYTFTGGEAGLVINNGSQYEITLTKVVSPTEFDSNPVTLTPGDKTPQNVTVSNVLGEQADISWDAVSGDVKDYTIYVKNTDTGNIEQSIENITGTSTTVFGLSTGTNYEIWVTAVSILDKFESDDSSHKTFKTADEAAPSAPTNVTAEGGDTVVDVSWDANTEYDLDGYNVYVDGVKDNSSLISGTSYQVTGLSNNETFDINVTAVDVLGNESDMSTTVSATTEATFHLTFNGTDQYLNIGTLGNFGGTHFGDLFAVEFSFILDHTGSAIIIGMSDTSDTNNNNFGEIFNIILNMNNAGDNVEGQIRFYIRGDDGGNTTVRGDLDNPQTQITDGNKHSLYVQIGYRLGIPERVVLDGTELSVDVAAHDIGGEDGFLDFTRDVYLAAAHHRSGSTDILGSIKLDDFRIWTESRTLTQIQNNMNSELNGDESGLSRYWKFNEGTGDIASEVVTSDDATLVGNVNDNMWATGNLLS